MIEEASLLWQYLLPDMRALLRDGEFLVEDSARHTDEPPTDFSYIVFPFAKLYEGFLKKVFLDIGIIDERDYHSDHFRIGKVLSPNLARQLGSRSAYGEISTRYSTELAARLWHTWKEGRNMVFHYFPHNFRCLTRAQAIELVNTLTNTMAESVALMTVGKPLARE
jgi:hypothetical protein